MIGLEGLAALARRAETDGRRFRRKLAAVFARIPFAEEITAAWLCARDPATPAHVRRVLLGAVAYFVLPADLVPDLLAGVGFTDDAAVVALVLSTLGRHVRPEHREEARRWIARLREETARP